MSLSSVGDRTRERYQATVPEHVRDRLEEHRPLLLVLPGLIAFSLFMFFPLAYTIYLSFTDAEPATVFQDGPGGLTGFFGLRGEESFVGLENYIAVFSDPTFWNSLGVTWLFVICSVALKVLFGVGIAMIMTSDRVKGRRYMRSIIIIPWALPPIFTITIWSGIFSSAQFGLANQAVIFLGFSEQAWLNDRWMAFASYLLTEMWLAYPFMVIITVSALQAVSDELMDAAKVDGAGYFHRFWHVTVPSIKRPVMFAAILTAAASFTQFLIPYVFNRGGPNRANELIVLHGYQEAFNFNAYGAGAAIMMSAVAFIGAFMIVAVWKGRLAEGVDGP
ncbi:sugar ABC transporter permease [Natronococcus sp. A-GB1]|uniref:Carbohydrate ABC transporter membrane protein 1, cut1 family n=1 Tax=Natronococcus amylolyticus DSM 10524 TaxID=1227497 RepID=L9XEE0_9EURY|nr:MULTISPECIES: sugar ABC transporter permease [Natronococcus]ELY60105.1 carbohydrate ABC transporter membrane protein 1, cut1 family [Natronococcus amylolyticus DSM 10524]MDG5760041.1 sugar ABC transporter permease [Natronococcus sp. A-GB1]